MFKPTSRTLLKAVSLLVCLTFISGCGTQESSEPSNSQTSPKWNKTLNETDLFELKVPLEVVTAWGLKDAEKDEFYIKDYSDPNREYQDSEVVSVIPDYCMPLANLFLDSKESGADLYSYQSFISHDIFSYFAIGMRAFSSPELARSKFDEMINIKDKCQSFIPKYRSGETESEWELWSGSPLLSSNSLTWEFKDFQQANNITIVGSVIYEISTTIEDDLMKAKEIRDQAKSYFDKGILGKQR